MNMKTTLMMLLISAGLSGRAATIYLNFGDNTVSGNWNNYDLNGTGNTSTAGKLNTTGVGDLIDDTGASSGVSLALSRNTVDGDIFTSAATAGDYASSGLPSWFNTSDSAMRESYVWGNLMDVTYTFSGFNASDVVEFSFLIDATSNSGDRRVAVGGTSGYTLGESQTRLSNASLIFDDGTTVTGATSYTIVLDRTQEFDAFSGAIPAMSITVIPEPGTLALLGVALGSLLLFRRRRS